ncbi:hypothetical protein A2U01_0016780 [Trifolium medium]|uniref:Uncharacterized protein n=1 Tax=Trifolium medium TaxID=97028 RepID=A0A392N9S7_9FABA|nr:hypothetical protein [Trifolium medium]
MGSPMAHIINALKKMLLKGPEYLLREVESFSSFVDDLRDYSWRLSSHESCFLQRLLRLRTELVDDVPLIFSAEEADRQHRKVMSALFDQTWFVKESMRMYESNLAAYFHEEENCDAKAIKLRGYLARLEGRKKELQISVKEDVAKLLEKRHLLLEL